MTSREFQVLIAGIKSNWNVEFTAEKMDFWGEFFKPLDYGIAQIALKYLIETEKYMITIAHIKEAYQHVQQKQANTIDAIAIVNKAISDFGRYRHKEAMEYIEKQDPATYQIVKAMGFQNFCNGETNFIRPEFEKLHKIVHQEIKNNQMLSTDTRVLIADLRGTMDAKRYALTTGDDCY